MSSLQMAKLCHILSTICRCENQKNQPGMLKQRLDGDETTLTFFEGQVSNMRSSAGYMTCASCSEDVSERLKVKYPSWTASSCYQCELF